MKLKIYHNPRCSKSRAALAIVEQQEADFEVVRYLDDPLDAATVLELAAKASDGDVKAILRLKEPIWQEQGCDPQTMSNAELAAFASSHPKVLERAIVERADGAIVARPPEVLNQWL